MNVNVHQSEIDHAGQGLFVNNNYTFRKGEIMCVYEGELVAHDVATAPGYNSDYMIEVLDNEWVIDAKDTESFAKYANDPIEENMYNAQLIANDNLTVALVAKTQLVPKKRFMLNMMKTFGIIGIIMMLYHKIINGHCMKEVAHHSEPGLKKIT